ncbi:caspase family protein [Luteolibacter ambystomatis]|uniref:Caspase family protein n=1 Tax=Luteolibacter ambystomatis TaxID=2824561 RepID=A0A975G7G9_9BACT|nr:caspase family protein [Luteolibacter ambystomatis]QUE50181.1 caspase family protein [Luteolibacter ambystomatis]
MPGHAKAESRQALVIGNSAYQHTRILINPRSDAAAMSAKLRTLGFQVTERLDTNQKTLRASLEEFAAKVPKDGVCLIYYAGHGLQINGRNYLVPVDANLATEYKVQDETLPMDAVMKTLEGTGSSLNMLVLDCCRDDPFSKGKSTGTTNGGNSSRLNALRAKTSSAETQSTAGVPAESATRSIGSGGLTVPKDIPRGMFIAFATSPDTTAEDGSGANSPYTAALLEEIGQPGVDFEKVFKNVGARVSKATNGKQEPWSNSKFYGTFHFAAASNNTAATPAPAPPPDASAVPTIPANGFFAVDQLFDGTAYSSYNASSKKKILGKAQEKLKQHQLYGGSADGSMGLGTQKAILDFQAQSGLPRTGRLDAATQAGLQIAGVKETSAAVDDDTPRTPQKPRAKTEAPAPRKPAPAPKKPKDDFFIDT